MAALRTAVDARPDAAVTVPHDPATSRAEHGWFQRNWPLLALAAGAIAIALLSRHLIYPAFSWNRDEATYLWQVEALRGGHIFTTDGGTPFFYWPWLTGLRGGGFFSQYTIGWPAFVLVVDVVFGSPELSLVFGTVVAVLGTYAFTHELTRDRQLAIVSATLMLTSPIVLIQGGVYLGYLFSLGLGLFFGTALLMGLRNGSRWLLLVSGVILGWILLTRPFDAVLWGAPLFAYAAIVYWRQWQPLRRAALWSGIGFLPFLLFTLLYNHHISGSFTTFPITAKDPLDTFGFGTRRLMPVAEIFDYSIGRALRSVAHNLRTLPPFLVGGWLGAVVVFVGIWFRRRERSTLALLGIALAFPAGYFFFWGNLLSSRAASLSGPVYYVPLYAPACVFVAAVLIAAWRRGRAFAIALCLVLAAVTVPYAASKVDPNHEISAAQEPWKDATDSIDQDALVIVENSGPYLLHLNPYSMNEPGLDGRILYALDRGAENIDAITAHLDRNPYLERTTDPRFDDPVVYHDAPIPRVSLIPLRVLHGNRVTLRVRVKSPSGRAVVAYVDIGNQVEQRTLSTDATPNETFETEWTLVPAGSPAAAQPGALTLTGRLGDVRVGVGSAPSAADALAGRQELEQFSYRVDDQAGTVDMLYPSRKFMGERPKRTIHLTEVDDLRGLDVELTVNH